VCNHSAAIKERYLTLYFQLGGQDFRALSEAGTASICAKRKTNIVKFAITPVGMQQCTYSNSLMYLFLKV
jgi:hypothetical protein